MRKGNRLIEKGGNGVKFVIEAIFKKRFTKTRAGNKREFPGGLAEGIKQEIRVKVNYQDLLKIKFAETLLVKFKIMGKWGILVCKYGSNNSNVIRSGKEKLDVNFRSVDLAKIFEIDLAPNKENKLDIYFEGAEDFPLKLMVKKIQINQ